MGKNCYIYTRVSTVMQVDGYSLEAQKEKLRAYAQYQGLTVVKEFSDEGKSGKNIDGRPAFSAMLENIKNMVDDIDCVLVFKLSRFGRNAADVLNSLQIMQDYGVNLICVEDGIDSSKDSGKLIISVLSSVAEIERDNILVQTMEGRRQKAREGKWNGGAAPYGYKLVDGKLEIAEDEVGIIRKIFDLYLHTTKGMAGIAAELNRSGVTKKIRQNGTMATFTTSFVTQVIDNPVYAGYVAYGRRATEKIKGTRNKYHIVNKKEYMLNEGIHEGIITKEEWEECQAKRKRMMPSHEKVYSLDHEHLLSGILRCPICGGPMYGNVCRKKNKDGSLRSESFYYACKHRFFYQGRKCDYRRQWNSKLIDGAIGEIIKTITTEKAIAKRVEDSITSKSDVETIEKEMEDKKNQISKLEIAKSKLSSQIDSLDVSDPNYDRKYDDMQKRLDKFYDDISALESAYKKDMARLEDIDTARNNAANAIKYLKGVGKVYDRLDDKAKRDVIKSLIEEVQIYPERQPDNRIIKSVKFTIPLAFCETSDDVHQVWSWDKKDFLETILLLCRKDIKNS